MKETIGSLIDKLSVVNIKIFMLIDKIQKNEHTKEDSFKCQQLNKYRSELMNAINKELGGRMEIKI